MIIRPPSVCASTRALSFPINQLLVSLAISPIAKQGHHELLAQARQVSPLRPLTQSRVMSDFQILEQR